MYSGYKSVLYKICFFQYFLPVCGLSFHFLMLVKSTMSIFAIVLRAFCVLSLPNPRSQIVFPLFSFVSFLLEVLQFSVLHLHQWSILNFICKVQGSLFCKWMNNCSLLQRQFFLHWITLSSLLKISSWESFVRFCFWTLCSVSLMCISVLMPIPNCLDYCSFKMCLEFSQWVLQLCSVFKNFLAILGLWPFHIYFRTVCQFL